LIDGDSGPYRDIVLLNATAGLLATGHESDMKTALARAQDSLDSGAARTALNRLIDITGTGS
jgi:anthranilate phosphoribosyltransferase